MNQNSNIEALKECNLIKKNKLANWEEYKQDMLIVSYIT